MCQSKGIFVGIIRHSQGHLENWKEGETIPGTERICQYANNMPSCELDTTVPLSDVMYCMLSKIMPEFCFDQHKSEHSIMCL